MSSTLPLIKDVHFEQNPDRLKVVMPVKRQQGYLVIYNVLLLLWLAMMIAGLIFTLRIVFSGERYALVFTLMLLVFLVILYRFGRFLRWHWGYHTANREILFINKQQLILRRPVSILGPTDAYDMEHVNPFYNDEQTANPAFRYGSHEVLFGQALSDSAARQLVQTLNRLYFPAHRQEKDEG
jgi:hypothetical protein